MAVMNRAILDCRFAPKWKRPENPKPKLSRLSRISFRAFPAKGFGAGFVAGQLETGDLADHGVAGDADLVGNLTAGEPVGEVDFQAFDAFGRPGRLMGGHVIGSKLDPFRIVLAFGSTEPAALSKTPVTPCHCRGWKAVRP